MRRAAPRGRPVASSLALLAQRLRLLGCTSLPLPGGADLGDDSYPVNVEFRDVLDLVPQSAVKVNDVTVGRVDDDQPRRLTRAGSRVRLNGDVRAARQRRRRRSGRPACWARSSSSWRRRPTRRPPGELADGDTIPLSRTSRNPEVEEVLGALSLLLNGGGVAQLKTITRELNKALDGREAEVRSVLEPARRLHAASSTSNKDEIVAAIDRVNALAIALKEQKQTSSTPLDELPGPWRCSTSSAAGWSRCCAVCRPAEPVAIRVITGQQAGHVANLGPSTRS